MNIRRSLILGFAAVVATACAPGSDGPSVGALDALAQSGDAELCGPHTTTLKLGQHIDGGTVTVSNDASSLIVSVDSTGSDWYHEEVHIFAGTGEIPTNTGGMIPGQFPYKHSFDPPTQSYTRVIPLDELGLACGEELNVAVHTASVKIVDGIIVQEETGWGDGPNKPGNAWGTSFTYEICCTPDEGEGCTLTQGYWKTHHSKARAKGLRHAWPLPENTTLCGQTWLQNLWTNPAGGDAFYILSHQWIAAQLNLANGASSTAEVEEALSAGGDLLAGCSIADEDRAAALAYAATLDAYNNGVTGPGHCGK